MSVLVGGQALSKAVSTALHRLLAEKDGICEPPGNPIVGDDRPLSSTIQAAEGSIHSDALPVRAPCAPLC